MSEKHHRTLARAPQELSVRGNYMEVRIGRIILDAIVRIDANSEYTTKDEELILFETVYSNLWDYRIPTYNNPPVLIDNIGVQHSARDLGFDAVIYKSKGLKKGTELPRIANEVEGKAMSLGWVAFPRSKRSAVPHRLIFRFYVFEPGDTSGSVQDSETLELAFDLSIFGRLLEDGKI